MRPLFLAAFTALVCSIAVLLLISCFAEKSESAETTSAATTVVCAESASSCRAQQILDSIYDSVNLKDGRIYLTFGARTTLTAENFTRLILEDQLGLGDSFSFLIDPSILAVLRMDNAYGGIGYGQEWIAAFDVCVKDNKTGELSSPAELVFTLLKSKKGDEALGYLESEPAEDPEEYSE